MTPERFVKEAITLYREAREVAFPKNNIFRGRSASISSSLEDLMALYISKNNPNKCTYYVDQGMKFNETIKYPDVVIQEISGDISNIIDLKTDMGFGRDKLYDLCKEWNKRIVQVKNTKTKFKRGATKEEVSGFFTKKLLCHVVILTRVNSGKNIDEHIEKVNKELKNVKVYLLTKGKHPNEYGCTVDDLVKKIDILKPNFESLIKTIKDNSK